LVCGVHADRFGVAAGEMAADSASDAGDGKVVAEDGDADAADSANERLEVFQLLVFPRPVEQNVLNPQLLMAFHAVIAAVIIRGIYRIWVFTKEATPRSFYRRLRYHK